MLRPAGAGVILAVALLAAAGPATPTSVAVKPPSAGVCAPATFRMEYFSGTGARLGEYTATFKSLTPAPNVPLVARCLWVVEGTATEAFLAEISYVPAGTPGRIPSGDCARNRPDSPPFYHSRKRQLTVGGGNRQFSQNAVGGNEKILKGVLAAAEAAGVGAACPGAAPPPPPPATTTPKPKPKPPAPSAGLGIDYRMPDRFGVAGPNGRTRYHDTVEEIQPGSWRVEFTVKRKDGRPCSGSLGISAPGSRSTAAGDSPCTFHAVYAKEGTYTVTVTLRDGARTLRGKRTFVVQDWLIVGLGDSNGSGEGAPDVPSPPLPARDPPVWQNLQCDRSAYSFEAQAARSIEKRDPRTSVTFVHLACSGASIQEGLLGAYVGINPKAGSPLSPQLIAMKRLVGTREIDAVVISIGVNDLGFAALVEHCILFPACQSRGFPSLTSPTTLDAVMKSRIAALPALYDRLSHSLKALGIPAPNVYLTEYFDSTRDEKGAFCDPLIRVDARTLRPYTAAIPHPFLRKLAAAATSVVLDFDRSEAEWANTSVLAELNTQVRAAASKHGWGLVSGVADRFRTHGYCADSPWIVGLFESFERQHDHNGTLHGNARGNAETAKLAVRALREDLYRGGRTRAPGR